MHTSGDGSSNDQAYEAIRQAIIYGDYAPGVRLGETELAERFGVSRTPIREALKRLAGEGLIVAQRRGMAVRAFAPADVRQIYDLRALLEGYAASQAALRRTEEDLTRLWQLHEAFERLVRSHTSGQSLTWIKQMVEVNAAIHEAIVHSSRNPYADFLVSRVVVLPLMFRSFYWYNAREMESSTASHATVIHAIADGDVDRARSAMTEHIYHGRDHVVRHIAAAPVEEDAP